MAEQTIGHKSHLQATLLVRAHLIECVSLQNVGHVEPGRQLLSQSGLPCMDGRLPFAQHL